MDSAKRWAVLSCLLLLLAACAVDGAPVVLEPLPAAGPATSTSTPTPTTTTVPAPRVLGTVITTSTTIPPTTLPPETSTTTTLPPLPEIEGPAAADFTLQLSDGSFFVLSDQKTPVLMVFWAEWCFTCKKGLPIIDRIAGDYGDSVAVLTVARESRSETVADLVGELMPSGLVPWGLDEQLEVSGLYAIPGVPVTILILGAVEAGRWLGSQATEQALRGALDECLDLIEAARE